MERAYITASLSLEQHVVKPHNKSYEGEKVTDPCIFHIFAFFQVKSYGSTKTYMKKQEKDCFNVK